MQKIASIFITLGLFLSGCTQVTVRATSTIAPTGLLTPYHTFTPSPQRQTATMQVTIPVAPAPTPTPYLYTVKDNDTMLGIAFQFGVKLEIYRLPIQK